MPHDEIAARLKGRFGDAVTTSRFRDNFRVHVDAAKAHDLLALLKNEHGFDMLVELGGADYLRYPDAKDRYGVWYCLLNVATGQRLIVKTFANDPEPRLRSVFDLWKGA